MRQDNLRWDASHNGPGPGVNTKNDLAIGSRLTESIFVLLRYLFNHKLENKVDSPSF